MTQSEATPNLTLMLLPHNLAIYQLPPTTSIPDWVFMSSFWSITRTPDEISLVVPQESVPEPMPCESGWRAFRFAGPLAFDLIGILVKAIQPLAQAQIPVFVLSTFNTDYLLVKELHLDKALAALRSAGYLLSNEQESS